LISSSLLTVIVNQLLPSSLPLLLPDGERPGILVGEKNKMLFIDARIAADEISKGNSFLVDVRDTKDFNELHPSGSFNIPFHKSENVNNEFNEKVKVEKRIFIMCEGILCDMSVRVASRLSDLGYKNIIIIKQDFTEWKRLNLPTEKGNI
jgi:rhodanese-related sulfurtransferase